jgi:cell division protein FtsZ
MAIAEQGIEELAKHVDSLIIIPNSKLPDVMGADALLLNAFKAANDVLQGAVQGIAELITRQGLINVDFADVRTVMSEMGTAVMGAEQACGEDRAIMAVQAAIGSPLLEEVNLQGACGVLVNITAGMNLTMREFQEIGSAVADVASDDATVVIGTVIDAEMGDELRVTVVATGLNHTKKKRLPKETVKEPMRVIRNGTTGLPEPGQVDSSESMNNYSLKDRFKSDSETSDLFSADSNIDSLDIPSFLRNQAD